MLKDIVIFALGALTGAAVATHIVKKKTMETYEEDIKKAVEPIKALYEKHLNETVEEEKKAEPDQSEYEEIASEYKSTNDEKPETPKKKSTRKKTTKKKVIEPENPYVISPTEFGEIEDYACVSLTYYADGYLADDFGELIENVEECIGWEALDTFGEYEPDAVHVRNDVRKTDYEILRSLESYKEA